MNGKLVVKTGLVTAAVIAALAYFCYNASTTYRDAHGKTVGTASEAGNKTTYRNATGKVAGTATESGNGTTYRDATGKTVGTKK